MLGLWWAAQSPPPPREEERRGRYAATRCSEANRGSFLATQTTHVQALVRMLSIVGRVLGTRVLLAGRETKMLIPGGREWWATCVAAGRWCL